MDLLYIKRQTISVKSGSDSNQVTRPTECETWDSWEIVDWGGHRLWGARVRASRHNPSGWGGQRYSSKNICHSQGHSTWETNPPSPIFVAHIIFSLSDSDLFVTVRVELYGLSNYRVLNYQSSAVVFFSHISLVNRTKVSKKSQYLSV